DRAEDEADRGRHGDAEQEGDPGIPAEVETLRRVGRDDVRHGAAGDAEKRRLRQREHAPVGGEEDQAGRGDAEEERLREDEADPVVAEKQGAEADGDEHTEADAPLDKLLRRHAAPHPGLPTSPWGRNASTSVSKAKVKTM